MSDFNWLQTFFFIVLFVILSPILGSYIAKIFQGQRTLLHPLLEWLEKLSYRLAGVDPKYEMNWVIYAKTLILFNLLGFLFVFLLHLLQGLLPLNPQNYPGTPWPLAFNTSISFVTNTNWQSYAGETTLSYLTQMLGLAVQNFLSAATGLATLMAFIRGIIRKTTDTIGNFWHDLVQSILYILLPLSILLAILLVSQGVIQTYNPYVELSTLEGSKQTIPLGPVASQIAIKQLGTNGGGYFNANSAHPFENPTAISNFLETLAIILIPAALVYAFGKMVNSSKHAWILYFVMLTLWLGGFLLSAYSESLHDPVVNGAPLMEGKETRFGIGGSILWSVTTTSTANGSVNSMISSLTPLAGGVALFNIMLGEIIYGGVGVGLCGMIMFTLLTVFLCGLMVGRTPEYFGKKIEKQEMQWVTVSILTPGALILIGAGISSVLPIALASLGNKGPHGLSEIIYAFASCAGNNGSAFAGLNANTDYYNIFLGFVMLLARLAIIIPSLAVAGLLARKKITPASAGTFSTESLLFGVLLISVILIIGALTFFPAMSLGPIVEQILMLRSQAF